MHFDIHTSALEIALLYQKRKSEAIQSHSGSEVSLAVVLIGVTLKTLIERASCVWLEKKSHVSQCQRKWQKGSVSAKK